MKHAEIVRDLIAKNDPVAVTLSMGYMVTRSHERINFSDHYGDHKWHAPRIIARKENKSGRCTALTAVYGDGSQLRYTCSEKMGARYRVLEAK